MLEDLPALAASLGSAGFLGSFTAYLDYGLLVIEDANSRTRHDEWDDRSALVNVRADSLCIRTRVYVDGPVTAVVLKGDKRIAQGHLVKRNPIANGVNAPGRELRPHEQMRVTADGNEAPDQIRTDEAGAARDDDGFHPSCRRNCW